MVSPAMEPYAASVITQVQVAYQSAPPIAYAIVALGTTAFGNLVAIPAVFLGIHGRFGENGIYLVPASVLAGHLFGDVLWYVLGRTLADTRRGEWLKAKLPKHRRIQAFFETGSVWVLTLTKLMAASTAPILFLLGWYRTAPRRYARLSLISAGVWFGGILAFCLLVYSGIRIVF